MAPPGKSQTPACSQLPRALNPLLQDQSAEESRFEALLQGWLQCTSPRLGLLLRVRGKSPPGWILCAQKLSMCYHSSFFLLVFIVVAHCINTLFFFKPALTFSLLHFPGAPACACDGTSSTGQPLVTSQKQDQQQVEGSCSSSRASGEQDSVSMEMSLAIKVLPQTPTGLGGSQPGTDERVTLSLLQAEKRDSQTQGLIL